MYCAGNMKGFELTVAKKLMQKSQIPLKWHYVNAPFEPLARCGRKTADIGANKDKFVFFRIARVHQKIESYGHRSCPKKSIARLRAWHIRYEIAYTYLNYLSNVLRNDLKSKAGWTSDLFSMVCMAKLQYLRRYEAL